MLQRIGARAVITARMDMFITRGPLWGKDAGRIDEVGTVIGGSGWERFWANARIHVANFRANRKKLELRLKGVKA